MKKVLIMMAAVAIVVALAVPAVAQVPGDPTGIFPINWSDSFNYGTAGANIVGNHGWVTPASCVSPKFDANGVTGLGARQDFNPLPPPALGLKSAMKVDLRNQNTLGKVYLEGIITADVWDPWDGVGTPAVNSATDTRVGITANYPTAGDAGSMSYVQALGITSSRGTVWTAYSTSGFVTLDGTGTGTGYNSIAGYTLTTAGLPAAPRKAGWNTIRIYWATDLVAGLTTTSFFVNPDYSDPNGITPNAIMNAASPAGRYNNVKETTGIFVGSGSNWYLPGTVDNIRFSATTWDPTEAQVPPVPEPSSLLALGTGLFGLMGLIRRRK